MLISNKVLIENIEVNMSKEKWKIENIPDLTGKTVVVTGSTSGLGKETARVIAGKNAKVIMAVRNIEKGEKVADEIRKQFSNALLEVRKLDLSSIKSIKAFAESFIADFEKLDVLINNAGIMMCPYSKTADGFEIQMGTNHFGHFALTGMLMPLIFNSEDARIVSVASMAHAWGDLDFKDLTWEDRKYNTQKAYGDSKIANLYFIYELSRRFKENNKSVKALAAHPGWTSTDLQRHSGLMNSLNGLFAQKVEIGVLPTLRAAFDIEANSGDYFGPDGMLHWKGYPELQKSNDKSYDPKIAEKLWKVSEELTAVNY